MTHHQNANAGALPWAGMPGVKCVFSRTADGTVTGKIIIERAGKQPIVIQAKGNEEVMAKQLMKRFGRDLQVAKAGGHVGLFGFLKKIKKMAKKIVRGKILGTVVKGFKSVMKIPLLGPALGVAVPALGATYLALKGAEALGISPWQARKMRKEKDPRKRAAYARKIRARSRLIARARWARARRRAAGRGYRRPRYSRYQRPQRRGYYSRQRYQPQRRGYYGRPQRGGWGRLAGDGGAETAGLSIMHAKRMLARAHRGCPKTKHALRCVKNKAARGDANAITAWKVLQACMRRSGLVRGSMLISGTGAPEDDLENLITAAGGDIDDLMAAAGVEDEESLFAVAGVDLELDHSPEDDEDEDEGGAVAGAVAAVTVVPDALDLDSGYYNIIGGYEGEWPVSSIGCAQPPAPAAAGYHQPTAEIVTGADGIQRTKVWNGIRWIWSELRPHTGIRSETQGFGLRDALLYGMQQIQARELAS